MDFIHVTDIARSVVAALDCERGNVPINIGTGISTSIAELAEILIEAVGANVEPVFNPRDVLVSKRAADISRAREVLDWMPSITVREGMNELVNAGS